MPSRQFCITTNTKVSINFAPKCRRTLNLLLLPSGLKFYAQNVAEYSSLPQMYHLAILFTSLCFDIYFVSFITYSECIQYIQYVQSLREQNVSENDVVTVAFVSINQCFITHFYWTLTSKHFSPAC